MPQEIYFYASSESQQKLFEGAALGLEKHGVKCEVGQKWPAFSKKVVACWNWRKGAKLKRFGHEVLVFERGYLGDRFHFTSIGWNGLNGNADFCLPDKITGERFDKYYKLQPWFPSGDKIIIMGQVPGDMSLGGKDLTNFYNLVARDLETHYRKKVYFREHPDPGGTTLGTPRNFKPNIPLIKGNLEDALSQAFLVVTWNSNAGVDAVVNGIPALSFDIGSMAYPVTGHSVEERIMPGREEWAHRLSYCQWSPKEIQNGSYWQQLKKHLEII